MKFSISLRILDRSTTSDELKVPDRFNSRLLTTFLHPVKEVNRKATITYTAIILVIFDGEGE
jgi:hypothetical protein